MSKILFAFICFSFLATGTTAHALSCAPGWKANGATCTPNDISTDYYNDPADPLKSLVCGGTAVTSGVLGNRIPVLSSFEPLPISTSSEPNTSNSASDPSSLLTLKGIRNPPTVSGATQDFTYAYSTLPRCVCAGPAPVTGTNAIAQDDSNVFLDASLKPTHNALSGGVSRVYPDTFDVISTQNQNGTVLYNMVAYSTDAKVDGRQGSVFSLKNSTCGCPNINEIAVSNGSDPTGGFVGYNCQPRVSSSTGRVLTTYDPKLYDSTSGVDANVKAAMGSQIIQSPLDKTLGMTPLLTTSDMVPIISIPTNAGGTQQYTRKIWTCAPPYVMSGGICVPPSTGILSAYHACGTGNAGDGTESPVSTTPVSSGGPGGVFAKVINQKLACCMNDVFSTPRTTAGSFIKFDCIDNSAYPYNNSFDTLWGGSDKLISASNGSANAINALVLAGPMGKHLTGFYTLNGVRCDAYNEFGSNAITSKKLIQVNGVWKIDPSAGAGITLPTVADPTSDATNGPPQTPAEMQRCPILVRAAMIASCPANSDLPVVQRTYTDPSLVKYCSAASSIQIHVRIEQIYEIAGTQKMKTVDTVQEQRMASSISVDQIIAQKNGSSCPPGSIKQGDVCVYN